MMMIMRSRGAAVASSGARMFSTRSAAAVTSPANLEAAGRMMMIRSVGSGSGSGSSVFIKAAGIGGLRRASTVTLAEKEQQVREDVKPNGDGEKQSAAESSNDGGDKRIASYWGVPPSRVTKEDGTEWRWRCFRVWLNQSIVQNYLKLKKSNLI